jgi:hypothetical protein
MDEPQFQPKSRHDGLLIDHVGDETIVYDEERQQAHSLNRPAAIVWQASDGEHTVEQLATVFGETLGVDADKSVVEYALDELARVHLLEESDAAPFMTRRDAVRRMSLAGAAAVAIPVILSMAAPTAAMAASGSQNGQGQNNDNQGPNQQ